MMMTMYSFLIRKFALRGGQCKILHRIPEELRIEGVMTFLTFEEGFKISGGRWASLAST